MLEYFAPGFLYSLLKDAVSAFRMRQRRLTPSDIVALRQKWKQVFDEKIWEAHKDGLRHDVIIRDMKRIDKYPDVDEKEKGISPWFRAGLMGTYHRGILVGLRWTTLTQHGEDKWRFTNHAADEHGDIKVILLGNIRYEDIEDVNWCGDEYYGFPHIFCFFIHKREPYEHVAFCTERTNPGGLPFYTEVAPYEQVRRISKKLGLDHAG